MKNKMIIKIKKNYKNIIKYVYSNRLFLAYVILSFIGITLARHLTIGDGLAFKPMLTDFALIVMIGSLGYFIKSKNQFRWYFSWILVYTTIMIFNSIYYMFYASYASFGELASLGQVGTVGGSIFEKLSIWNVIYILIPIIYYWLHIKLKKHNYYNYVPRVENSKKMLIATLVVGTIFMAFNFMIATRTDYSRLTKQWYRVSIVKRFGLIMFQFNDLVQTITPKFSSLFGYEEASTLFKTYFTSEESVKYTEKNKYTDILKGKNIVFVHMEGLQDYLMDLSFNGVEATPNLNKLSKEGMFFKNFYPQISTGTSSDTEFTILTSLLPASSGVVFTSYYNKEYITTAKLLNEKDYFTFSMHGNHATMWNRNRVHPNLGYQKMYFEESFTYTSEDVINLGINDKLFFEQAIPILENIETTTTNYMGTIITLSNHSPFTFLDKYGEYDMSSTFEEVNLETNLRETRTTDYLKNTAVGNYITSSHYADSALGDFLNYIKESAYFNDTVFVFYGDHDAKLTRKELDYLYNYDYKTGELKDEEDESYIPYDSYAHELNKKTPLIIWTKNAEIKSKLKGTVDYYMGMIDVAPTLYNMLGIKNDYVLGHDIFNIKNNNIVVLANGNFITNLVYYNNSRGEYQIIKPNAVLDADYINNSVLYVEKRLELSNAIIVHDLIKLERNNVETLKKEKVK